MADKPPEDGAVGYGRPPRKNQFKPGQSGNPRGRPKGVRSLESDITRTLARSVAVSENGKTKHISTQEAILRRLREKALKGDQRALEKLLLLAATRKPDPAAHSARAQPLDPEDQANLDDFLKELREERLLSPVETAPNAGRKKDRS